MPWQRRPGCIAVHEEIRATKPETTPGQVFQLDLLTASIGVRIRSSTVQVLAGVASPLQALIAPTEQRTTVPSRNMR